MTSDSGNTLPDDKPHDDKPNEPISSNADKDGEKKDEKKEEPRVSVMEMFQYADRVDKWLMVVGGISAFAAGAGMPAFSYVFGEMINNLVAGGADVEQVMADTSLIMVYVGLVVYLLQATYVICYLVSSNRQIAIIKSRFFASILRQDIAWHDEHKPGELTARMTGDTRVIQNGINDKLSMGFFQFGMFIFGFGFGFYYSWELTLVMFGTMPLIAVVGAVMSNVMTAMTEASREHFARAGAIATEVMENIRTVQVFGREDFETSRFEKSVREAEAAGIKKEFVSNASIGVTYCVMFSSYTIAFFFSSYLVEWKRNDVGEITATFFSVLMGSFGAGLIFPSVTAFTEARAAAHKVYAIVNRNPDIDVEAPGKPVDGINTAIEFRNIKFSYPTRMDQKLFTDLSLVIPRGKKVAFSGASGCGKSSIIGLLQRFYDPQDGQLLVDGVDMKELCLKEWRSNIGIVSQEPSLFSGSMADNVRVGKHDATMEEVIAACKAANIHDTIMLLPDQYETSVGAVGSQLSGGQKQRLAIARAIIKKPRLLILDEATSALDRKSEVEVQAALDLLLENSGLNMTVVVIAHRLATIRNVDTIYYISFDAVTGSAIAESGSFDELMALKGQFAAMASKQGAHKAAELSEQNTAASPSAAQNRTEEQLASADSVHEEEEGHKPKPVMGTPEARKDIPIEKLTKWEVENTEVAGTRIIKLNRDKLWSMILGVIGSVISGGVYPAYAVVLGRMLNILGRNANDIDELRYQTGIFAPLFIALGVGAMVGWVLQAFYGYAGEHLTTKLRVLLFRNTLRQDQSFYDAPGRDAGALSGLLSGDCEAVHQLYGQSIGFKIQMFCNISVGLIIGFVYQWKLAFVTLSCLPVMVLAGAAQQVMLVGFGHQTEKEEDSIVTESLSNIRTVVSFNLGQARTELYSKSVASEVPKHIRSSLVIGIIYGFSQFTFYGVFALAFWYGGKLVANGETDFEGVMITTMAVLMGAMGAGEAGGFAAKMADASESAKRVFAVIDRKPNIDPMDRGDMEIGGKCDIRFDGVQFVYPARPKQVVLKNIHAEFADKSTNGLMGQTGCGKSTTIQMLARFYGPKKGSILVNGKSIAKLDLQTWRENISIVLQEPNLFSGTVAENIRYSKLDATQDEIEHAAKLACIHDDILAMPNGYDTDVGYKGRALSGGQKQRVAIARGLLRKPVLLLLDEATSALDNATEGKVQEGIDRACKEHPMTVVSIAHRLTTIRHSDKILLLDEGEILEEGNHDTLMALNGEYKVRWELFASATGDQ